MLSFKWNPHVSERFLSDHFSNGKFQASREKFSDQIFFLKCLASTTSLYQVVIQLLGLHVPNLIPITDKWHLGMTKYPKIFLGTCLPSSTLSTKLWCRKIKFEFHSHSLGYCGQIPLPFWASVSSSVSCNNNTCSIIIAYELNLDCHLVL